MYYYLDNIKYYPFTSLLKSSGRAMAFYPVTSFYLYHFYIKKRSFIWLYRFIDIILWFLCALSLLFGGSPILMIPILST
jgi:hypothetical protein